MNPQELSINHIPPTVVVQKSTPSGPMYLAAFLPPWEMNRDEFAVEREELVLRSAWLRVGPAESADDFARECTRLNALRGVHRGPSRPAPF